MQLWNKIVTTFYRRLYGIERRLESVPPQLLDSGIEFHELTPDDLWAYAHFRPDCNPSSIQHRLKRGDKCFAIIVAGAIRHTGWVAVDRVYIPYLECDLILRPSDIYQYDIYTAPAYQQQGLSYTRSVWVLNYYRELGYKRSVGFVAVENSVGLRAVVNLNYEMLGQVNYLRLGLVRRYWFQPQSVTSTFRLVPSDSIY